MKVQDKRRTMNLCAARLRRARRLYTFLCRHALLRSSDNSILDLMNERMVASGMYARDNFYYRKASDKEKALRDRRYRIARWTFNNARGRYGQAPVGMWTKWLRDNGFDWGFNKLAPAYGYRKKVG